MKVYTFSQARQRLAALLDQAWREGSVRIRRRDGREFVVEAAPPSARSPLDVPGLNLPLDADTIVALVQESRRSTERFVPAGPATDPVEGPALRRVSERVRKPRSRRRK